MVTRGRSRTTGHISTVGAVRTVMGSAAPTAAAAGKWVSHKSTPQKEMQGSTKVLQGEQRGRPSLQLKRPSADATAAVMMQRLHTGCVSLLR